MPLLFRAHQGDSFRCPAIARHCFSILRLHYAKHLPAAPLQHHASLHFSIALPRYASPRKASAVLLVPKQNSAYPMQFLAVRRSASPLLGFSTLCLSFATRGTSPQRLATAMPRPASPLLCPARLCPAIPLRICALRVAAVRCHRKAYPSDATHRHCPVRRAYQPTFSSGKKFASSVMRPNFSAVPPRLFPSSSSIL